MKGLVLLIAAASAASAHTIFVQLDAGGKKYPVSHAIRTPTYDGPITDVTSKDLACNGGPNPTTASKEIITVTAGSTVKAVWRHTLTASSEVMDPSHKGPTLAYLKKVDNALTDSGVGGGWFKIQDTVITNGGLHYIDIPSCIPMGNISSRAEMMALHGAGSIPGIYKANRPRAFLVNIYSMMASSTYKIPGPPLFTCSGSGSSSGGTPAVEPATTLLTATKAPAVEPTVAAPAEGDNGCSVAQWQQCGGTSFSGCNKCASPYACKVVNAYYHQCS
ncbi:glycosyl hydrolase family 61-domain-containing protein [Podospora didyma]|uniref:lytic cellulose monooxygenase (C4-dehydrogenating) n=1 Tax=Podospora didyma TaxID=330526 RepID=A0AAE0N068_9PEZI|nr:glycosyl hydrolase family 61-domain-containing protein [Podospora didyma]